MLSRRSSCSRQSGSSRISDDQISDLVSKLQHLIPELRGRRTDKGYNSSEYSTSPLCFLFFLTMMAVFNNVTCVISYGPPPTVFLNHRGAEVRYNFLSHLIDAFERNEINFFVDHNELRGEDLKKLFVRIEESRIALAIFSTRYTESSWCMDELLTMKKLADQRKLVVIPIFYKVEAEHVREQKGEFGENFWTLAKKSSTSRDQIKNWMEALECISDKTGLSYGGKSSEADFVKKIVKEVQRVIAAIVAKEVSLVIKRIYVEDLLEEDVIVQWYNKDIKRSLVMKNVTPLIEWLQNAESESEEE